jgi:hypothetical protein
MPGQNASKLAKRLVLFMVAALSAASIYAMQSANLPSAPASADPTADRALSVSLLSDPFLQLPTDSSVQIVWFTEFEGTEHWVEYGDVEHGDGQSVPATTTQLSRTREDSDSRVQGRAYPELTQRPIWRHAATVEGLVPGDRLPYQVISQAASGQTVRSDRFTLAANPPQGQPLKILLTSDHQMMPLTPVNLQKVVETVGQVDGVFLAGDLVNVPDRASEWFDDARGLAFFPGLQGRANYTLEKAGITTAYQGGALIQHAPLFPAIGNHEVMGRYSTQAKLKAEFTHTLPRNLVNRFYPLPANAASDEVSDEVSDESSTNWLKDHSYNSDTYEEIFSLPTTKLPNGSETQTYYAISFGDVRLISLYVTQVWRSPDLTPNTKGRYRESQADLATPEAWGYGQHIFEDIQAGSPQYEWLKQELASNEFKSAKYKIVMLHHPPHTLGGNIVPAFTDPVSIENRAEDGTLTSVQYEYPKADDYLTRDLLPLLENANVQLVFYGHSHLWNRFVSSSGMHFLETSNVGNSYGAHLADNPRGVPTEEAVKAASDLQPFSETYSAIGDPNGLEPIMPTLAPLKDDAGRALPYIASNDITSFTIFDTGNGTLSSYYFDTRKPNSSTVKFDEFRLTSSP